MTMIKTFEQWKVTSQSVQYEQECTAKGVKPKWCGGVGFPTREEAVAYIHSERKAGSSLRFRVQHQQVWEEVL